MNETEQTCPRRVHNREMGTRSGHIIHNWLHIEAVNVPGGGDRSWEQRGAEARKSGGVPGFSSQLCHP